MIEKHFVFKTPENEEIKIWRYLDFTKFLDLLNSQKLHFTRADKFDDIFEGSLPIKTKINRNQYMIQSANLSGMYFDGDEISKEAIKTKEKIAINCWHINQVESAAMWKLYTKSFEGIAIQSTYKKLEKCLHDSEEMFFLGTVNYINYEDEDFYFGNMLSPYVHKRKSFEHEKEIRALIWQEGLENVKNKIDFTKGNYRTKINIVDLIENIYVTPESESWFVELVNDVICRFGYNFKAINSSLSDNPIF